MINLKVLAPLLVGALAGVVLLIVGALTGNDALSTVGVSVLGSALGLGGVGYRAPNRRVARKGAQPRGKPRKHRET